jgi:hypothetical protein
MSGPCDHKHLYDIFSKQHIWVCYCFCGNCYDQTLLVKEGSACVCDECFCRTLTLHVNCRAETELMTPVSAIAVGNRKPVETVIKDLPEKPGKTGTCKKCKAPTYRKGDRGRFPTLCEDCKNN